MFTVLATPHNKYNHQDLTPGVGLPQNQEFFSLYHLLGMDERTTGLLVQMNK